MITLLPDVRVYLLPFLSTVEVRKAAAGDGGRAGDVFSPQFPFLRLAEELQDPKLEHKNQKSRARAGSDEPDPGQGRLQ